MSELFDEDPRADGPADRPPSRRSRALVITAVVLVLAFFGLTTFANLYTNVLWFDDIGFGSVYSRLIWTRIGLFVAFGAIMGAVVAVNMRRRLPAAAAVPPAVARAVRARPLPPGGHADPHLAGRRPRRAARDLRRHVRRGGVAHLHALAQRRAVRAQGRLLRQGHRLLRLRPALVPLRRRLRDGRDRGRAARRGGRALPVRRDPAAVAPGDRLSGAAQAQLSVLLGVFVLAKALDYWLDRYDLAFQKGSLLTGITYTDENAVLPAKSILMGIALICAVLFFLNVWRRTWLLPSMGLALLVLSAILLGLIWPGHDPAVPGQAQRGGPRVGVHLEEHRGHPSGVRHRRGGRVQAADRRADRRRGRPRHRPERQLGAAGRPAAGAPRVRAEPAGPRLLLRGRRARRGPLRDQRRRPGAGARRARARPGPAQQRRPELAQPAHRLHARQRRDRGVRQPARRPTTTPSRSAARSNTDRTEWAQGFQAGENDLERGRSASTRRASTSARTAPTTPWSARPARTRPTSSSTSSGGAEDDDAPRRVRRPRRRRPSAARSASCSTPSSSAARTSCSRAG